MDVKSRDHDVSQLGQAGRFVVHKHEQWQTLLTIRDRDWIPQPRYSDVSHAALTQLREGLDYLSQWDEYVADRIRTLESEGVPFNGQHRDLGTRLGYHVRNPQGTETAAMSLVHGFPAAEAMLHTEHGTLTTQEDQHVVSISKLVDSIRDCIEIETSRELCHQRDLVALVSGCRQDLAEAGNPDAVWLTGMISTLSEAEEVLCNADGSLRADLVWLEGTLERVRLMLLCQAAELGCKVRRRQTLITEFF